MPRGWTTVRWSAISAALVLLAAACPDAAESPAQPPPQEGGAGMGGGVGGEPSTGALGGGFFCEDIETAVQPYVPYPPCDALSTGWCVCEGCSQGPTCSDPEDQWFNDCVCPQCAEDGECNNPIYWVNNHRCDPYYEGCASPDCQDHPWCRSHGPIE